MNIENILSDDIITIALRKVKRRKGASGIDMLLAEELPDYWKNHGPRIKDEIRSAAYKPQPAFARLHSKPGTKEKRKLEIPCVVDRMILSSINMVLSSYYEPQFSPNSFGFRNGLGCHDALLACLKRLNNGAHFMVDLDIRHFFDEVNHTLLFRILERDITDTPLLHLIESYVKTVVICGRHVYRKYRGLPQGFAISPLLANVFLNSFDQFLDQRQIKFVRYADDIVIFSETLSGAEENLSLVRTYFSENLKLNLNDEKTKIVRPWEFHYLGYAFSSTKNSKKYALTIDDKIKCKMLNKMSQKINQSYPSFEEWWQRLGAFNRGWINYYKDAKPCVMISFLQLAEQHQLFYFSEKVFAKNKNLSRQYISALYSCKNYSSLTGWYSHSVVRGREYLLRRINLMANKFTYWRSYNFYNHRQHLLKKYSALLDKPYFYSCHDGNYHLGLACQQSSPPFDAGKNLTNLEALIVGILAAGKNMTLLQLQSYLLLKGQNARTNNLKTILNHMIEQGIIIKHTIYQKDPLPLESPEDPLKHLECYRISNRGTEYARCICAPLDFKISYSNFITNIRVLMYYYTTTILWNQIVLNYILFCPTFKRFQMEFVFTVHQYGKQKIPLYVETHEQNYFFSYLNIISESKLNNMFRTWKFYQHQNNRKTLFVLISNSYSQICKAKDWLLREIYFNRTINFDNVAFSVVHSWFLDKPGIILPYQSIDE